MDQRPFRSRFFCLTIAVLACAAFAAAQDKKLSPDEIIANHLASIGKSDIIANSKKVMAIGGSEFIIPQAGKKATGRAVLASNGSEMAFFSTFDMSDYKMERIGIFDNKVNIPFLVPGQKSPLGKFLTAYDKTLSDRIFGGLIFSTWAFLDPNAKPKLETIGKKKVGDREAWVVRYFPKGGLTGGSYIDLYFDAENFHHLRTVYKQKETESGFANTLTMNQGGGGNVRGTNSSGDWSADMASNGSSLTEDFSDIRSDDGLMLPHKYTIVLQYDGAQGTHDFKWNFTIEEYRLIKDFPADFFSFKAGIAG